MTISIYTNKDVISQQQFITRFFPYGRCLSARLGVAVAVALLLATSVTYPATQSITFAICISLLLIKSNAHLTAL